ncbi:ACP S-malonyltransferase [Thorsellia anophelis]|uniref:Malonyl CoA-acyl carrier protein transacylase n=1 Tax=Thorsellia anophelis DSM 18579 TaxID=1123402 RepID=A0A1I0E7B8_9GAMM|nr:ACP S-malonyltransferase [Thorsellia anophelis]SET40319.1 [Acyl-carrier-protein] S-malonyltransferase [Thorsellia anophelis DSM 18579]
MSKIAFVFPGQGSQSLGMLKELANLYPIIKETFAQASDVLNYDLFALTQEGPEAKLNQTEHTQPALLAASVSIYRLWASLNGPKADYLAGHSLGEYSALVCAGILPFADAIKLVELRGQLMQQAVPAGEGAMSAIIGLSDEKIAEACDIAAENEIVSPVNYNSPGQVVIAGNKQAVERANILCKEAGAKRALLLPVSVPSHCLLMKPIAEIFKSALEKISLNSPLIPVINNVDVTMLTESKSIQDALVRQLYNPVKWSQSMQFLAEQGVTQLIEMGPGKVLTGLAKRIDERLESLAVNTPDSLQTALAKSIESI